MSEEKILPPQTLEFRARQLSEDTLHSRIINQDQDQQPRWPSRTQSEVQQVYRRKSEEALLRSFSGESDFHSFSDSSNAYFSIQVRIPPVLKRYRHLKGNYPCDVLHKSTRDSNLILEPRSQYILELVTSGFRHSIYNKSFFQSFRVHGSGNPLQPL